MIFSRFIASAKYFFTKGILRPVQYILKSVFRTTGFFIFFAGDSDRSKKELNKALDYNSSHTLFIYSLIFLFFGLLVVVLLGPFVYQNLSKKSTTFNVSAITEEVKVTTWDVPMSGWPVTGIVLSRSCQDKSSAPFTGVINLNPSVEITFTRIAHGELTVTMYSNANKSVGDLFDEEDEYIASLSNCAFFKILVTEDSVASGKSIVLPISGEIAAGNEIRFLTQNKTPVLRNGKITILDRSFIIGENYSVGPFDLETGDSFDIQDSTVPSQGFILINEEPAINLVYRAEGLRGVIKRYKSEDYELRNSYWSKLYNDEALSLAWILIIILFNIIRIYLRFLVN